jgi:CubicO group peptidase (beta-lactamase class C family)
MSIRLRSFFMLLLICCGGWVHAEPEEAALCKAQGYPVGTARTWFMEACFRVGSFSHHAEIPGIFGGVANAMQPAARPLELGRVSQEPPFQWSVNGLSGLTVDDYLKRQPAMALLIVKDGVVQVERYQYGRSAEHRFLSNSMAKTITAMGIGIALREGKIKSLDERADLYAPTLARTLYGETTIRNLLRMASGAKFEEVYDGRDDLARYGAAAHNGGAAAGAKVISTRLHPQGNAFNYASAETDMLALVMRGATGQTLSAYLESRLWQPMGAQSSGLWRAGSDGLERASGNFNATAQDYARLGVLLANDGTRADRPDLGEIIPKDFLIEATDWTRHPEAFAPKKATRYYGYGYQVWTFPSTKRRFALLGVYGQSIFVDPEQKLVMVHLAANATANSGQTNMAIDVGSLWYGVVRHYASW